MIKLIKSHFPFKLSLTFAISLVTLLLAAGLRTHHYWQVPLTDETADELAWTWLGASLIKYQQPISWSYYDQYHSDHIFQKGVLDAPLVSPALDHPPLFSFIPGLTQVLRTDDILSIPSRRVIRLPLIFLGVLNVGLLMLLTRRLVSAPVSLLAGLIYATAPIYVFSSRLVVAENLIITWALLLVLVLDHWFKARVRKKFLSWIIVALSAAAVLTKISGIVLPLTVIGWGLILRFYNSASKRSGQSLSPPQERDGKPRKLGKLGKQVSGMSREQMINQFESGTSLIRLGLIGLAAGLAILFGYAAWFNFPLFWSIQTAQAGRNLGLTTFYQRFLIHPTVAQLVFFDGWLLLGLLGFFYQLATNSIFNLDLSTIGKLSGTKKISSTNSGLAQNSFANLFLTFCLILTSLSLVFILLTSGEFTYHGWYSYSLFPFFALFTALLFMKIWQSQTLLAGLVWILLLPNLKNLLWFVSNDPSQTNTAVRILTLLGLTPLLAQFFFNCSVVRVNQTQQACQPGQASKLNQQNSSQAISDTLQVRQLALLLLAVLVLIINLAVVLTAGELSLRAINNAFYFNLGQ
ncbi:MAG: hypothetical protein GF381_01220 [Candidatus Pacebacteria bacterium]|nr:hypothetical protein [Candidatus Paceibacterota bacterium]